MFASNLFILTGMVKPPSLMMGQSADAAITNATAKIAVSK